jgi:hypothetical protein
MTRLILSLGGLCFLLAGCATPVQKVQLIGKDRGIAGQESLSVWTNRLSCDEGLRIDEGTNVNFQIVLFGQAAKYFASVGTIVPSDLNRSLEFVRPLQPDGDYTFVVRMPGGVLGMLSALNRSSPNFSLTWRRSSGNLSRFDFHQCH